MMDRKEYLFKYASNGTELGRWELPVENNQYESSSGCIWKFVSFH
jgi:hypothetical protein